MTYDKPKVEVKKKDDQDEAATAKKYFEIKKTIVTVFWNYF